MKVGTDSIMLGSWVNIENTQTILDIGTGSGLLAIMLAQKATVDCRIVGIDIDSQAITQAKFNGEQCPWSKQVSFVKSSLQQYNCEIAFDLIVCNPPYFVINQTANLQNNKTQRVTARQTTELTHADLLTLSEQHLSPYGRFCCVLPADIDNEFVALAAKVGLYCVNQMAVKSKPEGKIIRYLYEFSKKPKELSYSDINIHNVNGGYSAEYQNLCKQFYLNF